jgi:hypothetical protein
VIRTDRSSPLIVAKILPDTLKIALVSAERVSQLGAGQAGAERHCLMLCES